MDDRCRKQFVLVGGASQSNLRHFLPGHRKHTLNAEESRFAGFLFSYCTPSPVKSLKTNLMSIAEAEIPPETDEIVKDEQ